MKIGITGAASLVGQSPLARGDSPNRLPLIEQSTRLEMLLPISATRTGLHRHLRVSGHRHGRRCRPCYHLRAGQLAALRNIERADHLRSGRRRTPWRADDRPDRNFARRRVLRNLSRARPCHRRFRMDRRMAWRDQAGTGLGRFIGCLHRGNHRRLHIASLRRTTAHLSNPQKAPTPCNGGPPETSRRCSTQPRVKDVSGRDRGR